MYKIIKYFLNPVFIFCIFFLSIKKNTFCANNFGYEAVNGIGSTSTFLRDNIIDFSKYSTLNFIIPLFGWYTLYTILEKNFEGIMGKKANYKNNKKFSYEIPWWKISLTALSLMLHRKIDPGDGANIFNATSQPEALIVSARNSLQSAEAVYKNLNNQERSGNIQEALKALNSGK